ncbi:TonB-dependent receptor [Novosphingobium lentum]|uniref:TonB-dependent receptor n=1 Tax=Novosphingobium lentum TaxID=145287 RepID=UPI000ADADB84|nr:TonB-dependent siderophore receptor [Novosphingobium lentum]
MPSSVIRLAMLATASLLASPAWAADEETAPIVVTGASGDYRVDVASGTKTPTPLLDQPQSVTVLTRQQIDDRGVRSLGDALRYVPGVVLGQGEGHRDQVILRGQSTTADFFIDGLRDDAQYYRPLYNIERIEVLKGANALLFGRGGGGGVINRVSRTAQIGVTSGSLDGSVDSFGAWATTADLNLPLGQTLAARIDATYESFDNHRDVFGGRFFGVAPTLTWQPDTATKVTLAYNHDDDDRVTDRGVPSLGGVPITGYRDTFFGSDALNRSTVAADVARARIDHDFGNGFTANATVEYNRNVAYYGNLLPAAATATTVDLTGYSSLTRRESWIGQANLVWQGTTGPLRHTVLAGVEASSQDTDAVRSEAFFVNAAGKHVARITVPLAQRLALPVAGFDPVSRSSLSNVRTVSGYLQDQLELGEHVQLIAGLRYDDFRIDSTNRINAFAATRGDRKWSPRLGVVLKPQANMSLYASYAKSFLPQSGDQFTVLDASTATLAPESFRNLEVGAKWDVTPGLSFTTALYQLDRDNSRSTDPVTGNVVLTGRSRTKGFEVALAGQVTAHWQTSVGYTLQDGKILSTTTAAPAGRHIDKLPRHQFSAWNRYDVTPKLGLGLGVTHQSSSFATISNAVRLPAFTRVDAAVYYTVSPRIALQVNVENLFDTTYFPAAHTDNNIATGAPINARVSLKVKL